MNIPDKIMQNGKEIIFNANKHIAYEDLEGIMRMLGWGIIVESGGNENGEYIRFGNGWQVCLHKIDIDVKGNNTTVDWKFPRKFYDDEDIFTFTSINAKTNQGGEKRRAYSLSTYDESSSKVSVICSLLQGVDNNDGLWEDNKLFAIGKWK